MKKKIIIGLVITLVSIFALRFTFRAGAIYGMLETAKVYGEGLTQSVGSLDIYDTSKEYYLDFTEFRELGVEGDYPDEIYFIVTRAK